MSVQALANEYGVSLSTIHRYMPSTRTAPSDEYASNREQKIIALYSERVSVNEIARILNTKPHEIYRVLRNYRRQNDDPRLPKRLPRVAIDDEDRTLRIIEAIRERGNIAPVARQFGLTRQRIYQLLDDYYARHPNARRVTQNRRRVGGGGAPSKAQWVKTLRDAGVSPARIAAVTGLARDEIETVTAQA